LDDDPVVCCCHHGGGEDGDDDFGLPEDDDPPEDDPLDCRGTYLTPPTSMRWTTTSASSVSRILIVRASDCAACGDEYGPISPWDFPFLRMTIL
jgi:hypothetical protein